MKKLLTLPLLTLLLVTLFATVLPADDFMEQVSEDPDAKHWQLGPKELPPLEAIVAKPAPTRPVYGIYLWGSEYERAWREIEKMGVRSLRLSGPSFEMDEALKIAARRDMEIMVTLSNNFNTPGWRNQRKLPEFESEQDYLETLVTTIEVFFQKYGPGGTLYGDDLQCPIAAVEILNEPNYHYLIPDRQPREEVENEREALYAKILPLAHETISQLPNPLPVVGFACGGGGATRADYRFVEGVYENGGDDISQAYDLFSTHPYTHGAPPEAAKIKPWGPVAVSKNTVEMRKLLARHGAGDKPIWWTEVGYEMSQAAGGLFPTDQKKPDTLIESEDIHAAYIIRTYLLAMRLGIDRVHVMHLHDTDNYNSGLVDRATLKWRPAAHAIQNITTRMPNPKLVGAQADGPETFIYEFISDHSQGEQMKTIVAWNLLGPKTVAIDLPGRADTVSIFDMVGNQQTLSVTNGRVNVEIGPYPVYIQ